MFAYSVQQSLRHRLVVLIIALGLVAYGLMSLRTMPIDVLPDLTRPLVTLITEAEGLSPEEVESLVTYPIESAMSGLTGMQSVRSTSGPRLSGVHLAFDRRADIFLDRPSAVGRPSRTGHPPPPGLTRSWHPSDS